MSKRNTHLQFSLPPSDSEDDGRFRELDLQLRLGYETGKTLEPKNKAGIKYKKVSILLASYQRLQHHEACETVRFNQAQEKNKEEIIGSHQTKEDRDIEKSQLPVPRTYNSVFDYFAFILPKDGGKQHYAHSLIIFYDVPKTMVDFQHEKLYDNSDDGCVKSTLQVSATIPNDGVYGKYDCPVSNKYMYSTQIDIELMETRFNKGVERALELIRADTRYDNFVFYCMPFLSCVPDSLRDNKLVCSSVVMELLLTMRIWESNVLESSPNIKNTLADDLFYLLFITAIFNAESFGLIALKGKDWNKGTLVDNFVESLKDQGFKLDKDEDDEHIIDIDKKKYPANIEGRPIEYVNENNIFNLLPHIENFKSDSYQIRPPTIKHLDESLDTEIEYSENKCQNVSTEEVYKVLKKFGFDVQNLDVSHATLNVNDVVENIRIFYM